MQAQGAGQVGGEGRVHAVRSDAAGAEAAERVRLRYPGSRFPRPLMVIGVGLLALGAMIGLVWAASSFSQPPVAGQVAAYTVRSDREIAVTVTVDRRDPSVPVVCRVVAQAADFGVVGSVDRLEVGPRPERLVNVTLTIATLRRATSASVKGCSVT